MYEAAADPYCYAGTAVLKNIPGLRGQAALDKFEAIATAKRAEEPLPDGTLNVAHYRAIHHHLFQDIYRWAGRFRRVRIAKADAMFCYPENIPAQMRSLFADLKATRFLRSQAPNEFAAAAAHFLATLNAIHPFRDGNGRTRLAFLSLMANRAGYPLALDWIDPDAFLVAMIASFHGEERHLANQIQNLVGRLDEESASDPQ
jgi:cell filamentation protein